MRSLSRLAASYRSIQGGDPPVSAGLRDESSGGVVIDVVIPVTGTFQDPTLA